MTSRTNAFNAYESNLNGGITDTATSLVVDANPGPLVQPAYLILEPDSPTLREVILVDVIAGTAFSSLSRGLPGSASGGQAHSSGAVIRSSPVHQQLDDTFTDIEALEAADAAHFGGIDTADHPEVTPSVRGFSSAADKTKLDGIATGAVADHDSLTGVSIDDHHDESHKARHEIGGADVLVRVPEMVRNRRLDDGGGTISTTEAIEKTLTITIPATWNTYDVDIFIGVRVLESGVFTASRNIELRIRRDSISGTIMGATVQQIGQTSPNTIEVASFNGFILGETATGARDFHFTTQLSGDSSQGSWDDLRMIGYAWRIT